jgi:hypothetical protein
MALNPSMVAAIARSRTEEPPVLQKPTTAAVLNAMLAEVLGLTTLQMMLPEGDANTVPATGSDAPEAGAQPMS